MSQQALQALEAAAAALERARMALRTSRPGCSCSPERCCAAHTDAYDAILDAINATQMTARR